MTSEADRRVLLRLARDAITAFVTGTPQTVPDGAELLSRRGAAFVSLHKNGTLRGCIGHVEADEPLAQVIARCAVAAGSTDPRFEGVTVEELAQLDIEISLLGPFEPVASPDDIEIGRHGLVVEDGWHRGLLLPQVATEWEWDRDMFLAQTCHKAGLAPDAWKKGAKVWRFEAEVFGERQRA